MLNKQWLLNWIYNQLDMEISCMEDLEMTEGEPNLFCRGRISAWELLLKELQGSE
jgi:hypothetical protein